MRIDTPTFIACESILWLRSDGTETMIEAKIGAPYQVEGNTWACPASLEGVDGRYPDIVGEGSLHSLSLALQLIATRLGHLIGDNEQLMYPGDRSPWNSSSHIAMFGKPKSS